MRSGADGHATAYSLNGPEYVAKAVVDGIRDLIGT